MVKNERISEIARGIENKNTFDGIKWSPSYQEMIDYLSVLKDDINSLEDDIRVAPVESLPLPVRLLNVFKRENISTLSDLLSVENARILKWPGLGKTSIRQLADLISKVKDDVGFLPATIKFLAPAVDEQESVSNKNPHPKDSPRYYAFRLKELILSAPDIVRDADIGIFDVPVRLENVFKRQSIAKLNDLLNFSDLAISGWQNLGRKSIYQLCSLLEEENIQEIERKIFYLASYREADTESENSHEGSLTLQQHFEDTLKKLDKDNHRIILEERLGMHGTPKTLDEVGLKLGITRERVRQIQAKSIKKIIRGETWDDLLHSKIDRLLKDEDQPIFIDELHKVDSWFMGFEHRPQLLLTIINLFSHISINSLKIDGRFFIANISQDVWDFTKRKLLDIFECGVDFEYTLEDVEMLVERELSLHRAKELSPLMFDALYKELIFSAINGEFILTGVGNSREQLIRAILEESNTPLHYEDIAKIYTNKYGVDIKPRNVHARLNYSQKFLIFERGIYGLNKHLLLTQEDRSRIQAVAEEIILSDARKQWHSSEVLNIILKKNPDWVSVHLTKYTLNIILNESKVIQYLGKMVWASGEGQSQETERLHIRKAVANILRSNGGPMQIGDIQEELSKVRSVSRDLQLSLQPNSLFSRIDPSTWGLLDRDFILTTKQWETLKGRLYESLSERKRAYHVTELLEEIDDGRLPPALTELHVFGVLTGDARFKTWRGNLIGLQSWKIPNRLTMTEALQIVSRESNGTLKTEEIVTKVRALLGHPFDKNTIGIHMNKNGFYFDREEGVWRRDASN